MVIFAVAVFFVSLAGTVALFVLKQWEERTGRTLAPTVHRYLDVRALQGKELLVALQADLEKLPPELVHLAHIAVHTGALEVARLARFLEAQAHRLADFVSHKHRFERRAPRSEFLKKVIEHKNGNGSNGVDTTE